MINPNLTSSAPIAALVREWHERGYSTQFLRRLLRARLDAAQWHAEHTDDWRDECLHLANVDYLEAVLAGLDESEVKAA